MGNQRTYRPFPSKLPSRAETSPFAPRPFAPPRRAETLEKLPDETEIYTPPPPPSRGGTALQRKIGNAGAENKGRVAHDTENVVAKITDVVPVQYMPGAQWPQDPTIYSLDFYNQKTHGMALGDDPSYDLVEKEQEQDFVREHGERVGSLIPLRSPLLQGLDEGAYILDKETETIKPAGGGNYADGNYAFVIMANGTMKIGSGALAGHTGLAQGTAVLMAGELKIAAGKATYASSRTGHYFTNEEEEKRGIELMKQRYGWIEELRPKGPEGEQAARGLLALGAPAAGGTFGHRATMKSNFQQAKALWDEHKAVWVVDVLMQSLTNKVREYMKEDEEDVEDEEMPAHIRSLTRKVEITGEMLRDMGEAIKEAPGLSEEDQKRPAGLPGYDETDPFAEEEAEF